MAGPHTHAAGRAVVWTSPFAVLWTVGTFLAAQFPILTDPLTVTQRPIKWMVVAAILTWEIQLLCELGLAFTQGDEYGRMGPFTFLVDFEKSHTMARFNNIPPYQVNGCLCVFFLAALPLTLILTTTTVVAALWLLILGAAAAFHIRSAGRRFLAWRDAGKEADRR